jgi:hypothetical protein
VAHLIVIARNCSPRKGSIPIEIVSQSDETEEGDEQIHSKLFSFRKCLDQSGTREKAAKG